MFFGNGGSPIGEWSAVAAAGWDLPNLGFAAAFLLPMVVCKFLMPVATAAVYVGAAIPPTVESIYFSGAKGKARFRLLSQM